MGRDRSTKMRCLVSDDTGLIKVVNLDGKGKVVQTMGKQSKERRVASLCWAAPDERMVAAGCKDGVIRLWRPTDGSAAGERADDHKIGCLYAGFGSQGWQVRCL